MLTVSVIIPTNHKRPEMLKEAIASVKAQTYPTHLIIADGEGLPWERVNRAVLQSGTDTFVTLMDDDLLMPNFSHKTTELMEKTGADIVSVFLETFGDIEERHGPGRLPFVTCLCRKALWEKSGGYDPLVGVAADADFYVSCLEHGARIERLPDVLFRYRKHAGQWSNLGEWEVAMKRLRANHPTWNG